MPRKTQSWQEMDKKHLSLETLVEEYLTTCRLEGKTPKTIRGYREKLSRFVRKAGGTLADFTLQAVRAYITEMQASKRYVDHPTMPTSDECVSAMTVRNHVRVLTAFSSWLHREDYLPENVLAKLRVPKASRKVMQTLNPEEIGRILGCLNVNTQSDCRDAAIVSLFLDTGLRCAELIGLKVADLHLGDGWLKVMGKGQKERIVPFGNKATRLLQRYVLHFRPKDGDPERVFLSWAGETLSES